MTCKTIGNAHHVYVKPLTGIPHRREDLRRTSRLEDLGVEAHESVVGVDWKGSNRHNSARPCWGRTGPDVKARHLQSTGKARARAVGWHITYNRTAINTSWPYVGRRASNCLFYYCWHRQPVVRASTLITPNHSENRNH